MKVFKLSEIESNVEKAFIFKKGMMWHLYVRYVIEGVTKSWYSRYHSLGGAKIATAKLFYVPGAKWVEGKVLDIYEAVIEGEDYVKCEG